MKKWFVPVGFLMVCLVFISSSAMAQMMGGPQMGGGPGGGFPPPPDSSISDLSPDGKLLYVYNKGALYQYSAIDMTLKGSVLVDSASQSTQRPGPPMMGGAGAKLLFNHDGKRIFIVQGKNIYVYEADGLRYLSRTLLPENPAPYQQQAQ